MGTIVWPPLLILAAYLIIEWFCSSNEAHDVKVASDSNKLRLGELADANQKKRFRRFLYAVAVALTAGVAMYVAGIE